MERILYDIIIAGTMEMIYKFFDALLSIMFKFLHTLGPIGTHEELNKA